jgi:hypothetical protein
MNAVPTLALVLAGALARACDGSYSVDERHNRRALVRIRLAELLGRPRPRFQLPWRCVSAALALSLLFEAGCERSPGGSARQTAHAEVIPSPPDRPEHESFRRLEQDEVTPALEARAKQFLEAHHDADYGAQADFTVDGKRYRAVLEEHYHAPGEPGPDGPHKGVTLYVAGN